MVLSWAPRPSVASCRAALACLPAKALLPDWRRCGCWHALVQTEMPYEYYSMPFCKPPEGVHRSTSTINPGTILLGIRIENSPYNFTMMVGAGLLGAGAAGAQRSVGWGQVEGGLLASSAASVCSIDRQTSILRALPVGALTPCHAGRTAAPADQAAGPDGVQRGAVPRPCIHSADPEGGQGEGAAVGAGGRS